MALWRLQALLTVSVGLGQAIQELEYISPLLTPWAANVTADNVWPEYPRPQLVRSDWLSLNGLWNFAITELGSPAPEVLDETILVPFCVESYLSGIQKDVSFDNELWYSRAFRVPEPWTGQRIILNFEAVDHETTVWINGALVGEHAGGYDRFSFDITDHLSGEEELVLVKVYDPTQVHPIAGGKQMRAEHVGWEIFYTPVSGIWQSVWLEPVPATHITSLKMVPKVDYEQLGLTVRLSTTNSVALMLTVTSRGKTISQQRIPPAAAKTAAAAEEAEMQTDIMVPNPELWSPENPFLYGLKIEAFDMNETTVDYIQTYFGMRKIELVDVFGFQRFFLNGRELLYQLGPLDQGFWPDGIYTAPTAEALKWDILTTKNLGYNMIRKHVKVEPDLWYYYADQLGILVWQDFPSIMNNKILLDQAAKEQFTAEVGEWVSERFNHPSIILWVVFNEGWGQHDTPRLVELTRSLDPSRIITDASGWVDEGVGDVLDVHCYPGPLCGDPQIPDPNRALVLGEFFGQKRLIPGHNWYGDNGVEEGASEEEFLQLYRNALDLLLELHDLGYNAAVVTQTTDVEGELNGLYTYDRRRAKTNMDTLREINLKFLQSGKNAARN